MILSVSRRTDIPAFYSKWFFNRLKEGYVLVRNPMNYHQVSRIKLTPDVIDFIVFWTKNPTNMIGHLDKLKDYNYYFQISINPYDKTLEKKIPVKKHIIESFIKLSKEIGKERVIWRYAPIILTRDIDIGYHVKYFEYIAKKLSSYTNKCIFGYLDLYKKTKRNMRNIELIKIDEEKKISLAKKFKKIADKYDIELECCYGEIDLSSFGIKKAQCINKGLISEILGQKIEAKKDIEQTNKCTCIKSIDIGAYNSCKNACIYCYANYSDDLVGKNALKHDENSPFLIGNIEDGDKISDRNMESYIKNEQLKFDI